MGTLLHTFSDLKLRCHAFLLPLTEGLFHKLAGFPSLATGKPLVVTVVSPLGLITISMVFTRHLQGQR